MACGIRLYSTSHKSGDGKLRDLCDGSLHSRNNLAKGLEIILYYDDVEICNPLGSKAKIHKLGKQLIALIN